ncbi:MAG: hypothetical protein GX974_00940 [Clostridiales bacterium]|nr:hypothetical protein [Clostridiales bacterium]
MEVHSFTPMKQVKAHIEPKIEGVSQRRLSSIDLRPVLVIVLLLFLGKNFKRDKYTLTVNLEGFIKGFKTFKAKEALAAITPYLDEYEQRNIYAILGLLESISTIYGVADGTYQETKISSTPILFRSEKERMVGILNAIKPYISEPSRELVESITMAQSMSSKLAQNMRVYKSKRLSGESLLENLDTIFETVSILEPIIPSDIGKQLTKTMSVVRLLDAGAQGRESSIAAKDESSDKDEKENNTEDIARLIELFSQVTNDG